jgi:hypothetical protein
MKRCLPTRADNPAPAAGDPASWADDPAVPLLIPG